MNELQIINRFKELGSITATAKDINLSYRQVNKVLVKNKIAGVRRKRKRVSFNVDYFKEIDSEAKAYFLGFIYGDGSVFTTAQNKDVFAIFIHKKDKEILDKLMFCLDLPNNFIETISDKNQVGFRTAAKEFVQYLKDAKKISVIDRIPKDLRRHFLRGFFDADGTIYAKYSKGKYKYYYAGFIGDINIIKFCIDNIDVK